MSLYKILVIYGKHILYYKITNQAESDENKKI